MRPAAGSVCWEANPLPVKFGGDPTGIANKVALAPADHYRLNAYFLRLQRYLEGKGQ